MTKFYTLLILGFYSLGLFAEGELTTEVETPTKDFSIPMDTQQEANAYLSVTNNTANTLDIMAGVKVVSQSQYIVNYCWGHPFAECLEIPASTHNTDTYFTVEPTYTLGAGETTERGDKNKLQIILSPDSPSGEVVLDVKFSVALSTIEAYATQVYNIGTQSIAENTLEIEFGKSYPNPATENVTIDFAKPSVKNASFIVMDGNGQVVNTGKLSAGQTNIMIDTYNYASGVYYFVALDGESYSAVKRFVVQK